MVNKVFRSVFIIMIIFINKEKDLLDNIELKWSLIVMSVTMEFTYNEYLPILNDYQPITLNWIIIL